MRRSCKNPLYQVAVCVDGRPVMGGLFRMADQEGFSLADCGAGWAGEKIAARVREACRDAEFPCPSEDAIARALKIPL